MNMIRRMWLWLRIVGREGWEVRHLGPREAWEIACIVHPHVGKE